MKTSITTISILLSTLFLPLNAKALVENNTPIDSNTSNQTLECDKPKEIDWENFDWEQFELNWIETFLPQPTAVQELQTYCTISDYPNFDLIQDEYTQIA